MTITAEDLNKMLMSVEDIKVSGYAFRENMKRLELEDGESISVQASRTHYCTPRGDRGPWTEVEIGFPSCKPQREMMEYVEDADDPTGTVYAYVPIQLACDFINQHGGLKEQSKESA